MRRAVRDIDAALPVYNVRTLAEHVEKNLVFQRVPARMFVVLGPLLLVLVAIGIYAVVAYTVARRTTEIGVRVALGATAGRVARQMVGDVLRVVIIGVLAGWLAARRGRGRPGRCAAAGVTRPVVGGGPHARRGDAWIESS